MGIVRTLHVRIVLAIVLIGVLPLALVGLGLAYSHQRALERQASRELSGLALGLASEIDLYLKSLLDDTQTVAGQAGANWGDAEELRSLLSASFLSYSALTSLTAYDLDGRELLSFGRRAGAPNPTLFAGAAAGEQLRWQVMPTQVDERTVMEVLTPIRSNERLVGVLHVTSDLANISQLLGANDPGSALAFVVDDQRRLLLHPDRQLRSERPDYSWIGLPTAPRFTGTATVRFTIDGQRLLGAATPLPNASWAVVVARPEAVLLEPARRSWQLALGALVGSVLLAILGATLISRTISRPLQQLAVAAEALGSGDPTAPLPQLPTETVELVSLVHSFDQMRQAVSEALERQRQEVIVRRQAEEALREQADVVTQLNETGMLIAKELDLEQLVQSVTDAATELTGAAFGAFFYNTIDVRGESYTLYTISGVDRELFASFPMPRKTHVFGPTFDGSGPIVRVDDITADERYGKNPPFYGMPKGHLPVRSYMAASVILRTGEVIGGLFLGHPEPAVFSERSEQILGGLAAQAAVAMDNARLYEQARQAVVLRDQFFAMAAHELKTPLTAILGNAQLLKRRLERSDHAGERELRTVGALVDQSLRLQRLVSTLLDLSRIQEGRLKLAREQVDLCALINQIVDELKPSLRYHDIDLQLASESCVIIGDQLRLEQVFQNLISNAIRYSPEGGLVQVELVAEPQGYRVSVADSGLGIPASERKQIFERFFRASNIDQSQISGTGIGLYVVNEIVGMHGGSISVESELGRGSRFEVLLPLEAPPTPDREQPAPSAAAQPS